MSGVSVYGERVERGAVQWDELPTVTVPVYQVSVLTHNIFPDCTLLSDRNADLPANRTSTGAPVFELQPARHCRAVKSPSCGNAAGSPLKKHGAWPSCS